MPDPHPALLPVADYVERILATISPLPAFPQPLMEALGLALAEDVVAPISLPSFDNSAMDGYAARWAELTALPARMPVADDIPAGRTDVRPLEPGTVQRIMTGAPLPAGADVVVPVELTDRRTDVVTISETPQVSQPEGLSEGVTTVVPRTSVKVDPSENRKLAVLRDGVTLRELVDGLNALGIGPRDLISILQAIKAAGALQAEIEVI